LSLFSAILKELLPRPDPGQRDFGRSYRPFRSIQGVSGKNVAEGGFMLRDPDSGGGPIPTRGGS